MVVAAAGRGMVIVGRQRDQNPFALHPTTSPPGGQSAAGFFHRHSFSSTAVLPRTPRWSAACRTGWPSSRAGAMLAELRKLPEGKIHGAIDQVLKGRPTTDIDPLHAAAIVLAEVRWRAPRKPAQGHCRRVIRRKASRRTGGVQYLTPSASRAYGPTVMGLTMMVVWSRFAISSVRPLL
jgi:hypothetical protein